MSKQTRITITPDRPFNLGWLCAVLGAPLPKEAAEAVTAGYDTALETPSLHPAMEVVKAMRKLGQLEITVQDGEY